MFLANIPLWLHLIVAILFEIKDGTAALKQQNLLERNNVIEKVFHKRKKRFLIFNKGAAATFQGNIAKAIISGIPRGLNLLTEYTLTYDLPWNIEELFKLSGEQTKTTKPPLTTTTTTTTKTPFIPLVHSPYDFDWENSNRRKYKPIQQLWCPKEHIFHKYFDKNGKNKLQHCLKDYKYTSPKYKRSVLENNENFQAPASSSSLFFDLVAQLAKLHGYNARYCIMRALCESQHLLLPPGQLLFHDLLRILLSHAQPAMERHAPFRAAVHRQNLQECTQLYGWHCRHSFLQYFTESIAVGAVKQLKAKDIEFI